MKKHASKFVLGIGQLIDWVFTLVLIVLYPVIFVLTWASLLVWPSIGICESALLFNPVRKCFVEVRSGKKYKDMDMPEELFAMVLSSIILSLFIFGIGLAIYYWILPNWIWVLIGAAVIAIIGFMIKCWAEFHKESTGYYEDDDENYSTGGCHCCGGCQHCSGGKEN